MSQSCWQSGRGGPINTTADHAVGLWMHDTMAFTLEGVPLGLLDVQCWARDPDKAGSRATRHERAIKDKESIKWLKSFEALCELQRRCPDTELISMGDREADIYELLVRAKRPGSAKLLIRAERTRRMVEEHGSLWDYMGSQGLAGRQVVEVGRRHNQPARRAKLEIRFAEVELKAPKRKRALPGIRLWAVWAHEPEPPAGVKALDWMLLTTVAVSDFEEALERLAWYRRRWGIEVYHRTLKSGCRIEERQLGHAQRIEGCLAIDLVVAWRVYHLTMLGRETPDVPCSVYFEEAQWKALVGFVPTRSQGGGTEPGRSNAPDGGTRWIPGPQERPPSGHEEPVVGVATVSMTSHWHGPRSLRWCSRENWRCSASMIMGKDKPLGERAGVRAWRSKTTLTWPLP